MSWVCSSNQQSKGITTLIDLGILLAVEESHRSAWSDLSSLCKDSDNSDREERAAAAADASALGEKMRRQLYERRE